MSVAERGLRIGLDGYLLTAWSGTNTWNGLSVVLVGVQVEVEGGAWFERSAARARVARAPRRPWWSDDE